MNFFDKIGRAVGGTFGKLEEKNRKSAHVNRIRNTLKFEEKAAERQYIALGRYYYNNLRDKENETVEAHCKELDLIQARINAAMNQLEVFYAEEARRKSETVENIDIDDVIEVEPVVDAVENTAEAAAEAVEEVVEEAKTVAEEVVETAAQQTSPEEPKGAEKNENDSLPFE